MEYNFFERAIRKAKKIVKKNTSGEVLIKSAKWMRNQAMPYENKAKRDLDIDIISDINKRNSYPQMSMAIESAINDLLENGNYTFKNMLVIKNPYQYSPLCALALFNAKKSCAVKVTVKGKTADCDIEYALDETKSHRVPVMGLYPDYKNTVVIQLINKKGKITKSKTFNIKTAPLSGKSADIKITKETSKAPYCYDLTLVYGGDDGACPYAFDRNGDIRFCFGMAPKTYGFQPISDGRFIFLNKKVTRLTATNPASTQMFEVDQMGRFYKIYNVEKGAHHDFAETKSGNIVVASNDFEGKTYEDTVIEIDRNTGRIVNEIKIKDYIDPKYVDASDWAHLNSIQYDENKKTIVVSLRNLHTVFKIDYGKKELVWILGNPEFWKGSSVEDKVLKPEGKDMQWFFQAHAAYFLDADLDGNPDTKHLIIYDNHTSKRRPVEYFDNKKESYVRIYTINEKSRSASLFKSFPCELSNIRSNGIFEEAHGRVLSMSGKTFTQTKIRRSMITEFDYNTGEVLNEFSMNFGYYRAYEFKFEPCKMAERMKVDKNYCLGKVYEMSPCEQIDVSKAKTLPDPILEEIDKTEEDRKNRLNELVKKNPDYYVDPEQDMARIKLNIEDDVLYVTLIDHLLQGIYFVGKKHSYLRDFSDTKQERPEYFARAGNTDPIPLKNLKDDKYEIYYKHNIGLYKSGYQIEINKK